MSRRKREIIPEKITGNYSRDFNILKIDKIIHQILNEERFKIPQYKGDLELLKKEILRPQTVISREKSLKKIKDLSDFIKKVESKERILEYETSVKEIIHRYKQLKPKINIVIFDEISKTEPEIDPQTRERISLIDRYLEIANNYICVDIIRINGTQENTCSSCGFDLSETSIGSDGMTKCPKCMAEYQGIIMTKTSKDSSHSIVSNSTDDDSIDNFMRAFDRYQGVRIEPIPRSVYIDLDKYFKGRGRPEGEEIKKLPLNDRGRKGDTDHKMLWDALSNIGRSEFYEDANLIGHEYWGWTLPDVMHLQETVKSDYIKTQKAFYEIENRERESSLGTQFRLWQQLRLRGHECYIDEFKIPEDPSSLKNHYRLWKLMCIKANDPDIYFIP